MYAHGVTRSGDEVGELRDPTRQRLVQRIQEQIGLQEELLLVVLRSDRLVMVDPVEIFVNAVKFDNGTAVRLLPDPRLPDVEIDPLRAFGEPTIRSVPTEVIAE